ncbi:hypothetical protein HS088_TW19G00813 [Tripterygium wilfordii]|uniref:Uncharacterized protein n=1 Tax=Tripterygium wilfordii TaxID=458696 RepID=A0A7J7CAN3_TRIWF|nr:hypothetical protein HS088_TW19G00813 [Tripterygium wilfordii]
MLKLQLLSMLSLASFNNLYMFCWISYFHHLLLLFFFPFLPRFIQEMEIDTKDVLSDEDELKSCFENYRLAHNIQSPYHDKSYDDILITRIVKANSELKDLRLPLYGGAPFQHKGKFCVVFKPAGGLYSNGGRGSKSFKRSWMT